MITIGARQAARAQIFPRVSRPLRRANQAVFVSIAVLAYTGLAVQHVALVQGASAAWLAYGLSLIAVNTVMRRQRRTPATPQPLSDYWYATAFAAVVLGCLTLPSWALGLSVWVSMLTAVAGSLALMAGLTPFCVGRFIFVIIFGAGDVGACE